MRLEVPVPQLGSQQCGEMAVVRIYQELSDRGLKSTLEEVLPEAEGRSRSKILLPGRPLVSAEDHI